MREAHGVGFERAEDTVRSAKFAGFEAHSIPNLAIAFPPFRGSIFPIGCVLVHGFPLLSVLLDESPLKRRESRAAALRRAFHP